MISKLPQRLGLKYFRAASQPVPIATIYLIARRRSFPVEPTMAYGFGKLGIKKARLSAHLSVSTMEVGPAATPKDAGRPSASILTRARQLCGKPGR